MGSAAAGGGKRIDRWTAQLARALARRTSRRSFLAGLGALLAGGAGFPVLPVSRARAAEETGEPETSPDACSYWRYCSIDGFLSSCCGGSHTSCPPGTRMSPITWLGTCRNPGDGRHYVISYNDCCGKNVCGRCFCRRSEGDKPVYYAPRSNDIDWCLGTPTVVYNSTVAIVVGVAKGDA